MNISRSQKLFAEAQNLFPGGVNSPVRAFRAVGGQPLFIDRGEGAYLYDVDSNRFIDYVLSWGPLILGHAHPRVVAAIANAAARGTSYGAPSPLELELAKLIQYFMPNIEMMRFVNSGTEATMTALRLARAFTGRNKIVKFEGCYHGHADMLLVQAVRVWRLWACPIHLVCRPPLLLIRWSRRSTIWKPSKNFLTNFQKRSRRSSLNLWQATWVWCRRVTDS